MRPRGSILTGGFDFSGCGDFTSCPPVERAAMSNSDPSAIVLQGIPCIGGLYTTFDSNRENGSLKVCRDSPLSRSRMRYEVSPRAIAVPVKLSQDPDQLLLAAS